MVSASIDVAVLMNCEGEREFPDKFRGLQDLILKSFTDWSKENPQVLLRTCFVGYGSYHPTPAAPMLSSSLTALSQAMRDFRAVGILSALNTARTLNWVAERRFLIHYDHSPCKDLLFEEDFQFSDYLLVNGVGLRADEFLSESVLEHQLNYVFRLL